MNKEKIYAVLITIAIMGLIVLMGPVRNPECREQSNKYVPGMTYCGISSNVLGYGYNYGYSYGYSYTEPSSSGSSGGSSSSSSYSTYKPSDIQMKEGFIKTLRLNDKITFNINTESHSIKIDKVTQDYLTLTLRSDIYNITLYKGEEEKIDFENDGFYDLSIKLNNIKNLRADLTIKQINEEYKIEVEDKEVIVIRPEEIEKDYRIFWLIGSLILLVLLVIYYFNRK